MKGENQQGASIYCYVALSMRSFFYLACAIRDGKGFSVTDFGEVLAAGLGEPPDDLREEMARTHNLEEVPEPLQLGSGLPTVDPKGD